MNTPLRRSKAVFPAVFLFVIAFSAAAQANSIEGYVYDYNRNPLQDVDVELRDNDGRTRFRNRTDGIGRYAFRNLPDGRYYIKVFPFRYNLKDQEKEQIIQTVSLLGNTLSQTYQLDFVLEPTKGGLGDTTTGVVFAQEVPKEAREYYKKGIKAMGKEDQRDEGFKLLIKAVKRFPTYYEALNRLGMHLLYKKRFMDAAFMFVRAAEVNPKSSKSFYYMGISFSNLSKDYYSAAVVALEKAKVLAPNAHQIPLEIGKLQKKLGNYTEAEVNLIRAKKLAPQKRPEIHLELARLYGNDLKQYGKAADELELYLKASKKKDPGIKKKIANLRLKAKNKS